MVEVREDREVDQAERAVVAGGRLPPDELLADARCHHHAPGAHADPHRVVERGSKSVSPHSRIQWHR